MSLLLDVFLAVILEKYNTKKNEKVIISRTFYATGQK